MNVLRWLVSLKWGQIVCFTLGSLFMFAVVMDPNTSDRTLIAAIVLLATGLALKAIEAIRSIK